MADCLLPPPPGSCVGLTAAGSTGLSSVSLSVVLCMGKTDSVVLSSHKNIWSIPPFWWYLEGLSQWPHVGLQINSEEVRFLRRSNVATTCLFTRIESLIWSQQGFWQRVSAENVIYEAFVVVNLFCIALGQIMPIAERCGLSRFFISLVPHSNFRQKFSLSISN